MKNLLTIRSLQAHEAPVISELAMRSKSFWGYSDVFMDACREELTVTELDIVSTDLHYWVAESGSEILGFYAIEKLTHDKFELEALFVEPDFIGTGVGKALIEHAKQLVKKLDGNRLIIQGDPNAQKFYVAAGGKLIGKKASASIPGRSLPLFEIDLVTIEIAD